ncbi:mucin-5AC-like [Schistocerca serialis cubense]|uniref:mucin-5AC-like n=1 Tax=Schistocerca serialis cubense TaxID=2023355 RepID=UPI00214E6A89|nr:mucin-5AC-like [Schistocerca serialis cubense]
MVSTTTTTTTTTTITTTTTTTTAPHQLYRTQSQEHSVVASSPSPPDRAESSTGSSHLPLRMAGQDPGRLFRQQSPRNLSDSFDAATPYKSPRLQREQSPTRNYDSLPVASPQMQRTKSQEHLVAASPPSSADPPCSSVDWSLSPRRRAGQDPGRVCLQESPNRRTKSQKHLLAASPPSSADQPRSSVDWSLSTQGRAGQDPGSAYRLLYPHPDATTDSEACPLLESSDMKQESKCKDEAETNKGEGTAPAARDTRVISISSDDNESLDGRVGSHVMGVVTSADSENSGATVVTTEPPKSSPAQTMEPVKPSAELLSGTQWTTLSVPTGGVQSAAPQVLDKVPIAGATWQVPQSSAVIGANKFVTQPAEMQPLDLSRSDTRQQPPLQPPGVPPRLQLPPPPASSYYAIRRHIPQSGITSLPTPKFVTPRPPPLFPESPLLYPRTVAAPRTPKRMHRPTRPSTGSAVALQISAANVDRTPPYGMVTQPHDVRQSVIVMVPRTAAATMKCNNQTEVPPTSIPTVSVDTLSASSAPDPTVADRNTDPGAQQ